MISRHLLVANIPKKYNAADIGKHFNSFGSLSGIQSLRTTDVGKTMRIEYENVDDARATHAMVHVMDGSRLQIDFVDENGVSPPYVEEEAAAIKGERPPTRSIPRMPPTTLRPPPRYAPYERRRSPPRGWRRSPPRRSPPRQEPPKEPRQDPPKVTCGKCKRTFVSSYKGTNPLCYTCKRVPEPNPKPEEPTEVAEDPLPNLLSDSGEELENY